MKYESNILERLIKTYGVVGNPKYVSEIIKQFIIQGKECYPNLFTYQSDWLAHIDEFGLANDYVVTYTGQRFYAPNTKESPVKRAILKGNSEVVVGKNKCNMEEIKTGWIDGTSGAVNSNEGVFIPVEVSGTITISNYIHTDIRYVYEYDANGKYLGRTQVTTDIVTLVLTQNTTLIKIGFFRGTLSTVKSLELQVEQGEIATEYEPYNPTLVSVKMPVLTTTGKNLFKGFTKYDYSVDNGVTIKEITDNSLTYITSNNIWNASIVFYIPIDGDKNYIMSADMTNVVADDFYFVDELKQIIGTKFSLNKCVTSPTNAKFIKWHVRNALTNTDCLISNFQLEENSVTTTYEPFKSNILTTPEDLELRGIGDVKDELNLMTGELTQRIGEVVLDGKINISWQVKNIDSNECIYFGIPNYGDIITSKRYSCDNFKFITGGINAIFSDDTEFITNKYWTGDGYGLAFSIKKSKLESLNSKGFNNYLRNAPTTIHYHTKQESIKTVDLNIKDQNNQVVNHLTSFEGGTHFDTSSQTGSVLPTLEVDVVVDLEETLMMCSTEGNTM